MTEDTEKQDPRVVLAHKRFLCKSKDVAGVDRQQLQAEMLEVVFKDDLAPIYEYLCTELGWQLDVQRLAAMKAANEQQLEQLAAKIKDAEENLGETEVRDAVQAKAEYLAKIGDREAAAAAFKEAETKTASGGAKADMIFTQIRLALLYDDWLAIKALLAAAKAACDVGGDWEHKNKLKVYEAIFAMYTRDFTAAASLLLDSTATFTTSELFPYNTCIAYAVITSLVALDRVTLKKSVVDSPEVLAVMPQLPALSTFLNSIYACKYKDFFKSFLEVTDMVRADLYLHPHLRYYMREVRIVAYAQFLESYKSVTLSSMATAFDVSSDFLDGELATLIVAGRLGAKIDKVAGVVETKRPDVKNALYQDTIRRGDLLLNRIQKLSRVIDVE